MLGTTSRNIVSSLLKGGFYHGTRSASAKSGARFVHILSLFFSSSFRPVLPVFRTNNHLFSLFRTFFFGCSKKALVTEAMKCLNSGLEVLAFPHPLLRAPNEPIKAFGEELEAFVEVMFSKMYKGGGVGLAAPQLGVNKTLFVANPSLTCWRVREKVFANPTLLDEFGNEQEHFEGCLSFPNLGETGFVRPETVLVHAFDAKGKEFSLRAEGLLARVVQHEMDHLRGCLMVDGKMGGLVASEDEMAWIEDMESQRLLFEDGTYDELTMRKTFDMTEHQIEDIQGWMRAL